MAFCPGLSIFWKIAKKESTACKSEWGDIAAGVPQGRGHGTWLFNLMIDVDINTSDTEKWKYVDDTAIVEPVVKN